MPSLHYFEESESSRSKFASMATSEVMPVLVGDPDAESVERKLGWVEESCNKP